MTFPQFVAVRLPGCLADGHGSDAYQVARVSRVEGFADVLVVTTTGDIVPANDPVAFHVVAARVRSAEQEALAEHRRALAAECEHEADTAGLHAGRVPTGRFEPCKVVDRDFMDARAQVRYVGGSSPVWVPASWVRQRAGGVS